MTNACIFSPVTLPTFLPGCLDVLPLGHLKVGAPQKELMGTDSADNAQVASMTTLSSDADTRKAVI